jgi:Domain of unknown function (DUF4384)
MSSKFRIGVIVSLISVHAFAAEQRGAKAIFVDTTSGSVVQGHKPAVVPRTPGRSRPEPARESTPLTEVTGLMYYLELLSPTGTRSRVTADHMFRSGDRILVHVVSSTDGDVAVFQHNPDGSTTRLFPDARVNGGSASIRKGVDTVLPSPTSWFRFDDQTGTELLSIVLTPRKAAAATPGTLSSASFEHIRAGGGSKGLMLETENSGSEQATYVVRPTQNGRATEPIIVEIALKHR